MHKTVGVVALLGCLVVASCSADQGSVDSTTVESVVEVPDASVVPPSDFADPNPLAIEESGQPVAEDLVDDRISSYQSPIERELGIVSDPEEVAEALRLVAQEMADEVSSCMRVAGFKDFREVPILTPTPESFASTGTSDVANYGYGPSITLRAWLETASKQTGLPSPSQVPVSERNSENFDPTADYVSRHPEISLKEVHEVRFSCWGQLEQPVELPEMEIPDAIMAELSEVWSTAGSTPLLTETWDKWAECMANNRYDFASRDSVRDEIERQAAPLRDELQGHLQAGTELTQQMRTDLSARVEALAAAEYAIVDADVECSNKVGLETAIRQEKERVEGAWLEENRDRIPLLLAEAESGTNTNPARDDPSQPPESD